MMKDLEYKNCKNCVLDNSVSDITFDESGVCNYCISYYEVEKTIPKGYKAKLELDKIVNSVKRDAIKSKYDCIVGVSGGVDSTYLLYLVKELGLNPLAVHVDTGWNSEISVNNVLNLVKKLDVDLFTYVIDWSDMRDLQLAFFKASVPDCDIPQDHVFPAILHKIAYQKKIKHLISGHNFVTEYIIPKNWSYNSNDYNQIIDINKKFGKAKLKKYPFFKPFQRFIFYKYIYKVYSHRPLYFVNYNKDEITNFITNELGWKSYGGKHEESRFTKFFQSYYLYEKFGFDKRKAHLSNLILSKQMTRAEAIEILKVHPYNPDWLQKELSYMLRKMGLSEKGWDEIMSQSPRNHNDFASDENTLLVRAIRYLYQLKNSK